METRISKKSDIEFSGDNCFISFWEEKYKGKPYLSLNEGPSYLGGSPEEIIKAFREIADELEKRYYGAVGGMDC